LPNVFENGFSSIRKAAPPEEQEPEPFLKEPEPCQTSLKEKARREEQTGNRRGEWRRAAGGRGGSAWNAPARCHVGAATPGARLSLGDSVPAGGCGWRAGGDF
jgi:hypothetical protein